MKKQIYLSIALLTFFATVMPATGSNQPGSSDFDIKGTHEGTEKNFKIEYNVNTTVADVKRSLSAKSGIPIEQLKIMVQGKVLSDNEKIEEHARQQRIMFVGPAAVGFSAQDLADAAKSFKEALKGGHEDVARATANSIIDSKRTNSSQKATAQAWLLLLQ